MIFKITGKIYIATDSSPVDMQSYELCCDMIDVVIDVSCIYGLMSGDDLAPAFDRHSQASIKLNNGTVLHLREVNRFLALVCILRDDAMEKQGSQYLSQFSNSKPILDLGLECEYLLYIFFMKCCRDDRL